MAFSALSSWLSYFSKGILKKLFKLAFFIVLIIMALDIAADSQKVLDVGGGGNSDQVFKNRMVATFKSIPTHVLQYLHIIDKPLALNEIPDEVMMIYDDLDKRIHNFQIERDEKDDRWLIEKANKTAFKFNISTEYVMEIYVKVEEAKKRDGNI